MRDDEPSTERSRLDEVFRTGVLSRPSNDAIQDILEMARIVFGARTAALNIITDTEQVEKFVAGDPLGNIDRDISFCWRVVHGGEPLLVPDTLAAPTFMNNPLVRGGPRLRSYGGYPVRGMRGLTLGALCVLGPDPIAFDQRSSEILRLLARAMERVIVPETAYAKEDGLPANFLTEGQVRDAVHARLRSWRDTSDTPGAVLLARLDIEVKSKTMMTPRDVAEVESVTELRLADFTRNLMGTEVGVSGPWRYTVISGGFPSIDPLAAAAGTLAASLNEPIHVGDAIIMPNCAVAYFLDTERRIETAEVIDYCNTVVSRRRVEPRDIIEVTNGEIDRAIRFRAAHAKIATALRDKALACVYQPIVELETGALHGFEALMRWRDSDLGDFGAGDILEICAAEKLEAKLDYTIFEIACGAAARRAEKHDDGARIAVNVDTRTLQAPDFALRIKKLVASTGIDPTTVMIEVTEHSLFENVEGARQNMEDLRTIGIVFALDDFGTGYSSLSNLRQLPFGKLKIDRTFVSTIENVTSRTLIDAMLSTAKALGMITTGEGAETEEQLRYLAEAGCDNVQGYLISRPIEEEAYLLRV